MESKIRWKYNTMSPTDDRYCTLMTSDLVAQARSFHQSFPQYSVTPLHTLPAMAAHLGVGGIYVKDESYRFGLNAFKVLGGSFAMAKYIAKQLGKDIQDMTHGYLTGTEFQNHFTPATFFTATDGNHGRGVAWAARQLGQKAVVHMPKGSTKERFDNIAAEGATVTIEAVNYDECVRIAAAEAAQTKNGVIVQDTAWEGYEEIPGWIMQGYGTMAAEAAEQLHRSGVLKPSHIFVQAGVGSLAGAITGYFSNLFPEDPPKIVIMEAQSAACLYQSAVAGQMQTVDGDLQTIMAGLACGEPNILSWDILRNHAAVFVSCPDEIAARGMRMLAAPLRGDVPIVSGESGAVGMGLLAAVMKDPAYAQLCRILELDSSSRVLLFSTEGDTDRAQYENIVWGGAFSAALW